MTDKNPISFNDFYKFVDMNKDNKSLIYDINNNYFKNRTKITYNKENFLDNLDETFINKENLLNKSIKNIMNFDDFGIISIEDFFMNLNSILDIIKENILQIYNTNKNENIFIYYDEINKSNCWLSMILCKFLKDVHDNENDENIKKFIENNIFFIDDKQLIDDKKYENIKYNIIFIDDCSYSGRQLEQNIDDFYNKKNITIFVYCVYISNYAFNLLNNKFSDKKKFYLINHMKLFNICNNFKLMELLINNFYIFMNEFNISKRKLVDKTIIKYNEQTFFVLINTLDYLDIYMKNVIYKILEIKSADYLSIIQNLYNYIKPISFNIENIENIKIYKLKDTIKKKILDDVDNSKFCNDMYIDIFYLSNLLKKDTLLTNNNIFDNIFNNIFDNIELYEETNINKNNNENNENNYKNINTKPIENKYGLLDNCSNEKYKNLIFETKKGFEYNNDELCYSAYYRKENLIIKDEVLNIFNKSCLNQQNKELLQKLSLNNNELNNKELIISGGNNKINLIKKYRKYLLFKLF